MLYRSWRQDAGELSGAIPHWSSENPDLANAVVGFQKFVWRNSAANDLVDGSEQSHLGYSGWSAILLRAKQSAFKAK